MEVSKQERKQLKDIIHEHPLILQQLADGNNQPTRRCKVCPDEILYVPYYTCASSEGCNSFLHKYCGDLPLKVQDHPLHPQHTLYMGSGGYIGSCGACEEPCVNDYAYRCYECWFVIDVKCATLNNRKIKHRCHKHLLTPQNRPILSYCNACGMRHEGVFYQCSTCVCYWIHRDCASLPETIKHSHHVHTLDLFYACPEDVDPFWGTCKICSKSIFGLTREDDYNSRQVCWVYYCKGCRYVAHVNCAASKIEPFMQILLPPINVESRNVYIDPNALCFPMEGVVNELATVNVISRFLMDKDDDDDGNNKETTITHWSHPHHLLILHKEHLFGENGSPFAKKSFVLNKCDGCGRAIIASPFWRCSESECHFFLHKCCSQLRHSIHDLQHPYYHRHQIVLRTKPLEFFRAFWCGCCQKFFNGFAYQCNESSCQFYMDVECAASLQRPTIIHEAHPHHQLVLKLLSTNEYCNCCGDYIYSSESRYGCVTCKFNLHMRCVMYPSSVNHRFDKHPFKLTYIPLESQREEDSYCEICEKFIDPLRWFYSCPDCDRFMHPRCLFSIDAWYPKLNYFEYSEDYKVDCHPHQLCFSLTSTDTCDHCDQKDATLQQQDEKDPSRRWLGFYCYTCGYRIQARCAISSNLRIGKKLMKFPQLP